MDNYLSSQPSGSIFLPFTTVNQVRLHQTCVQNYYWRTDHKGNWNGDVLLSPACFSIPLLIKVVFLQAMANSVSKLLEIWMASYGMIFLWLWASWKWSEKFVAYQMIGEEKHLSLGAQGKCLHLFAPFVLWTGLVYLNIQCSKMQWCLCLPLQQP